MVVCKLGEGAAAAAGPIVVIAPSVGIVPARMSVVAMFFFIGYVLCFLKILYDFWMCFCLVHIFPYTVLNKRGYRNIFKIKCSA